MKWGHVKTSLHNDFYFTLSLLFKWTHQFIHLELSNCLLPEHWCWKPNRMRNDTHFCGVEFRRAELNWACVWGRRRVGLALSFSQSESLEETEVNDPELEDRRSFFWVKRSRAKIDLYSANIISDDCSITISDVSAHVMTPLTKTIIVDYINDTKITLFCTDQELFRS